MDRDRLIKKNISLGVLYKIFNLGIVFITLPILLKYLGTEQYGVWVTLFSIINTVIYLDGGIINGLKTKLAEVLSVNDFQKKKSY
ncbi:MAG: hypothetical protein KDC69_11045, partial [Flavobacteriaceae bacterium]|nr:hypothetical protein [Flavobacteriaceae bacterium]